MVYGSGMWARLRPSPGLQSGHPLGSLGPQAPERRVAKFTAWSLAGLASSQAHEPPDGPRFPPGCGAWGPSVPCQAGLSRGQGTRVSSLHQDKLYKRGGQCEQEDVAVFCGLVSGMVPCHPRPTPVTGSRQVRLTPAGGFHEGMNTTCGDRRVPVRPPACHQD